MQDVVIVALDYPDAESALSIAQTIRGRVKWVKVGMTLFYAAGPAIVRDLRLLGFRVFVDLKLHDIPHQVEGACKTLTRIGADMLTVHASGGKAMLEAAVAATEAAAKKFGIARPSVLAVTVLTSLDDRALSEIGIDRPASEEVEILAALSQASGCDGLVCSPQEAALAKELLSPGSLIVTPGIRLQKGATHDQLRTATPPEALAAGATHLVIGRPITQAADPLAALDAVLEEINNHDE